MQDSEFDPEICVVCKGCLEFFPRTFPICPYCNRPSKFESLGDLEIINVDSQALYKKALNFIEEKEILGLDTEGNSLSPFDNDLLLIQIGDSQKVFILDFTWHKKLASETFWQDKKFIIHNVKYDYKVLKH